MITIKPHHFMDIIKLYGAGIEEFVPDMKMGHDFYKVANMIINNPHIDCCLIMEADDICQPCVQCINGICDDGIPQRLGTMSKDEYNKSLDRQILTLLQLNTENIYQAYDLCQLMYQNKMIIMEVWNQEEKTLRQRRFDLFSTGCEKYLHI